MKLRQRILLAIGATTLTLIGGIYLLSSSLLLTSYVELEKREMRQDVDRVVDAMQGQAKDLHSSCLDWSNWDESYKFVQDKNKEYIDSNLSTMTLKLDMMLFLGPDGKIVYAKLVDRVKGVKPPKAESVRRALGFDKPEGAKNPKREVAGLASVDGEICLVSARPIVPSEANKPPRGWLVWVLRLDEGEITNLNSRLHLRSSLFELEQPGIPGDVRQALHLLDFGNASVAKPLTEQEVGGYGNVENFLSEPIGVVKVLGSRAIYNQGLDSVRQLLALIVVAALVFSFVFIAAIDAFALTRISKLTNQVERIADGQQEIDEAVLSGSDELSWLSRAIQGMVVKLRDKGEELRINHDRLRDTVNKLASANSVLEHAVEGIARIDTKGRIVATNVSFARNLGYRRGELCERDWKAIVRQSDHSRFHSALEAAKDTGKVSIEIEACRFDESVFHAEIVIVRSDRPGVKSEGFHIFMKDISERKWLETRIEHQAFHDSLTGLPNRAKFMDRLSYAASRARRRQSGVAVLFMDLDNFKIINDSLGHEAGDQLLIQIAQRLKDCLRDQDTIARLGGDEFTVLLQDMNDLDEATEVARRVLVALSEPINLPHCETVAGVSIGIAFSVCGEEDAEGLLRDADTAMYAAKSRGKSGYVVFDPTMNEQVVERMELEVGMRRALDAEEFTLEFQPIVDLNSGDITGVEALLRWEHPEKGRISPEKFIAVAEDSGLIVPIGAWVLREACLKHCELLKEFDFPMPFTMSVNVSGRQLQRVDAVAGIRAVLEETGLEPSLLKLEVTESVLIQDEVESVEKLHQIKELGVKIAIDDFGTGYSSLSSLNSSPVDVVKIDRTFISRMGKEEEIDAIVGAIILLSRVMHLEVTAEGIETREQVQYLQAFGCDLAQGYYFSKPLSWEGLTNLLSNGMNLSLSRELGSAGDASSVIAA